MDKSTAARAIIASALPHIPFDGWNQQVLKKAAQLTGYKKTDVIRVFPEGAVQAAEAFMRSLDDEMIEVLKGYYLDDMKIRERIATAIRVKFTVMEPHREAIRRAIALLALPFYAQRALRQLYQTADAIWYAAGDNSTDFNHYSKRVILCGVYSSTLLYWLDDKSPGYDNTWAFLDRRIGDVMKIEKLKQRVKNLF